MNTIKTKIRKVRELKGFSQEYLAQKLNISQRAYSKMECGEIRIEQSRLEAIAEALEISLSQLKLFDEDTIFEDNIHNNRKSNIFFQEKLVEQYEARIKNLESEVDFLRKLSNKS